MKVEPIGYDLIKSIKFKVWKFLMEPALNICGVGWCGAAGSRLCRFQSSNQTNNRVLVTLRCYISQQTSYTEHHHNIMIKHHLITRLHYFNLLG